MSYFLNQLIGKIIFHLYPKRASFKKAKIASEARIADLLQILQQGSTTIASKTGNPRKFLNIVYSFLANQENFRFKKVTNQIKLGKLESVFKYELCTGDQQISINPFYIYGNDDVILVRLAEKG